MPVQREPPDQLRSISSASICRASSSSNMGAFLSVFRSVEQLVCGNGEEIDELVAKGDGGKELSRVLVTAGSERFVAHLRTDPVELLRDGAPDKGRGDALTAFGRGFGVDPLPDLRTGDLGGGRIL